MECPNCGNLLEEREVDSRVEWCDIYYYPCKECGKEYYRETIYKTQSALVESDEMIEIRE